MGEHQPPDTAATQLIIGWVCARSSCSRRGEFIWSSLALAAMPVQAGCNFSFLGQMVRVI